MLLKRTVRMLGLAVLLGVGLVAPASATTLYESLFDDFSADWTVGVPAPLVIQGAGVATLEVMPGESIGRANSNEIVSTAGSSISDLTFSVDVVGSSGSGALVWIAYFQGGGFLGAEGLFELPASGPVSLVRDGSTLASAPVAADHFQLILYALGSTTFDRIAVTAPVPVPEPSLAVPTALAALAMLHARGRRRRS